MWKRYIPAVFVLLAFLASEADAQGRLWIVLETDPPSTYQPRATSTSPTLLSTSDADRVAALPAHWQLLLNRRSAGVVGYSLSYDGRFEPAQIELGDNFYLDVNGSTFTFTIPLDPGVTGVEDEIELDWAFYERRLQNDNTIRVGRVQIPFNVPDNFVITGPPNTTPTYGDDDPSYIDNYVPPFYTGFNSNFYPYSSMNGPYTVPNLNWSINPSFNWNQSQYTPGHDWSITFGMWDEPSLPGVDPPGFGGQPPARYQANPAWYSNTPAAQNTAPAQQGTALPPDFVIDFNLNLETALVDIATTKVWAYRDGNGNILDPNGNAL